MAEFYNIYQHNPNPFQNRDCFLGLSEEEMLEITNLYLKGGGQVKINGRKLTLGRDCDVFQIYKVDESVGSNSEEIAQFYLSRKRLIFNNKWDEKLFQENGTNITRETLNKVKQHPLKNQEASSIPNDENIFNLIHPDIRKHSEKLFMDGHYKESVQAAIVEVVDKVKIIYKNIKGQHSLDGKPLMMAAFAEENPVIKLTQDDISDAKGIQEGYKFIFAGMVLAIRNPKAHKNFEIDKIEAIEMLFMCSRLMRKLDERIK